MEIIKTTLGIQWSYVCKNQVLHWYLNGVRMSPLECECEK